MTNPQISNLEIPDTFIPLPGFHVPDAFWPAYGYSGKARYVALYWSRAGDEASVNDGRIAGDANWRAYLLLTQHPPNWRAFSQAARMPFSVLGSSDDIATYWLLVDREARAAYCAPWRRAYRLLLDQWPPQPAIEFTEVDLQRLRQALQDALTKAAQQPLDLDALIAEDDRRLAALQAALDSPLPFASASGERERGPGGEGSDPILPQET